MLLGVMTGPWRRCSHGASGCWLGAVASGQPVGSVAVDVEDVAEPLHARWLRSVEGLERRSELCV